MGALMYYVHRLVRTQLMLLLYLYYRISLESSPWHQELAGHTQLSVGFSTGEHHHQTKPVCDPNAARPRPPHSPIWMQVRRCTLSRPQERHPPAAPASRLVGETAFSLPVSAVALLSPDTISCNIQPLSDSTQFKAFSWEKIRLTWTKCLI